MGQSDNSATVINLVPWYPSTGYDIISEQIFREPFNRIRSARAHPRTSMLDNDTQALSSSASIRRLNFPNTDRVLRLVLLKSVTQRLPGPLRPRGGNGPQTIGDVHSGRRW